MNKQIQKKSYCRQIKLALKTIFNKNSDPSATILPFESVVIESVVIEPIVIEPIVIEPIVIEPIANALVVIEPIVNEPYNCLLRFLTVSVIFIITNYIFHYIFH